VHTPAPPASSLAGFHTTVVPYDGIPSFAALGRPFLSAGKIHLAHTAEEHVPKKQLLEAVEIYTRLVKGLLAAEEGN